MLEHKFETIELENDDGVLTATLNRPHRKNAMNAVLRKELRLFMQQVSGDPEVAAIVLTGAGTAFCAGADFELMKDQAAADWREQARSIEHGLHLLHDLLMVQQPIIAAVNGPATGLGATMAVACDLIVMADSAYLADTHAKVGIVAGDGGALLWPMAMGPARAKQFLMLGDRVTAQDAERWGLATHVAADNDVVSTAQGLARRLADAPRFAVEWTKYVVNIQLLREALAQVPLSLSLEARTFTQPDVWEGVAAFQEHRAPAWPSRAKRSD